MQWIQNDPAIVMMGVVAFLLLLSTTAAHIRINRARQDAEVTEGSVSRLRHDVRTNQGKVHQRINEVHCRIDRLTGESARLSPPLAAHAATDDDPDDEMIEQMAAVAAIEDLARPMPPRSPKSPPPNDDCNESFGWPGDPVSRPGTLVTARK